MCTITRTYKLCSSFFFFFIITRLMYIPYVFGLKLMLLCIFGFNYAFIFFAIINRLRNHYNLGFHCFGRLVMNLYCFQIVWLEDLIPAIYYLAWWFHVKLLRYFVFLCKVKWTSKGRELPANTPPPPQPSFSHSLLYWLTNKYLPTFGC